MTALNTPIAVNERCDPRLVAAIESFQRAIDVRMRMESRRLPARSVKLLAIEHVAPALDAITSELAGRSFLPPIVFKATIDKPLHLHWLARTVIRNLRCAGVDETTASVTADAMREVGHFLALWPKTVRVVPQAMRGEKGALMQLRHVEEAVSRIKCNTFSVLGHFLGHGFFRRLPVQRFSWPPIHQACDVVQLGLTDL